MPTGRLKILEYKTTRIFKRNSETEGLFFWFWWGFFFFFYPLALRQRWVCPWVLLHPVAVFLQNSKSNQWWCSRSVQMKGCCKFSWLKGITEGWGMKKCVTANHQVHFVHVFNSLVFNVFNTACGHVFKSYKLPWRGFSCFKNGGVFWIYDLFFRPK